MRLRTFASMLSSLAALSLAAVSPASAQNPDAPVPGQSKPAARAKTATTATPGSEKMLKGIDFMSATVMQEHQSSFSGLGMRVRLAMPGAIEGVEILPTIEYWRNSTTLDPYGIKATRVDATLGGDLRYAFHAGAWNPYVGGGFAAHFLSNEVDAPSFGIDEQSDSVVKGGFALLLGTTFGLTDRIDNFLELKYHHIPTYRQLKINWGISIGL